MLERVRGVLSARRAWGALFRLGRGRGRAGALSMTWCPLSGRGARRERTAGKGQGGEWGLSQRWNGSGARLMARGRGGLWSVDCGQGCQMDERQVFDAMSAHRARSGKA
jgi:hypothetical protein